MASGKSEKFQRPILQQPGEAIHMEIKGSSSQPSVIGSAEYFTGPVRIDPLFQTHAPARAVGARVTFEPGARTAWHTHPLGQTLIVTAGCGLVQRWAGPIEEIRQGDVVWFQPGEKHWHGATATTAMTHIAVQEQLDGKTVDWMETVSDEHNTCSRPNTERSYDETIFLTIRYVHGGVNDSYECTWLCCAVC
jgi:quercetin dioxygenase-like cupin family protein